MDTDLALQARVGRIERLVEHLYRHLGIPEPAPSAGLSERVRELALAGNTIGAIKLHREETGRDLATAKQEVESLL